jgi:hypothetical protein
VSPRSTEPVDATFYVQVSPTWGHQYAGDEERPLRGASFVRASKTRPERQLPGTVLAKLTLRIPAGAFYPLRPEAVIVIPDSMVELAPVEVTASDPHEPAAAEGGGES